MNYKYHRKWEEPTFNKDLPIFADFETINWYEKVRLVQLHQGEETHIFDCYYVSIEDIKYYLKDAHLVFHNILFDLNCKEMYNWLPEKIDDTMYMAKLYYPYVPSFSLSYLLQHIGEDGKGGEGSSDWSGVLTEEQLHYAAYDVIALEKLYYKMEGTLTTTSYKLDILNVRYALNYSRVGLKVHEKNRKALIKAAKKALSKIDLPIDLNINSPKQVKDFLGSENSSAATLTDLVLFKGSKDAQKILNVRKYTKQLQFLEEKFNASRVYGFFQPSRAKSGRWTCKDQNLQQLPRELKSCFGFEDSDPRYLVDADYSALELYCLASYTGDEVMYKMLKDGVDLHKFSATQIYNKSIEDVTKEERQVGKTANFSLGYGASAKTYIQMAKSMAGIVLTEQEATQIKAAWLRTYKSVAKWHKTPKRLQGNEITLVETPLGRKVRAEGYNDQLNIPVQGMGAECTKLAIHYLYTELPEARLCLTVHDSITLECESKEEAERQAPILESCMKRAFTEVNKRCKFPDLEIGAEAEVLKVLG